MCKKKRKSQSPRHCYYCQSLLTDENTSPVRAFDYFGDRSFKACTSCKTLAEFGNSISLRNYGTCKSTLELAHA